VLADVRRGMSDDDGAGGVTFTGATAEYMRWVEHVEKVDPSTVKDYAGVIDGYLVPEFGERQLDAITPDDIDAYKERLIAEGRLSNRTIVRHLTVAHGVFKRAARAYGLKRNPASADLVKRPKVVYTGEFDTYTGDEVELLAASAADAQDAALYRAAAYTGLRQGELIALRWHDVDFVAGLRPAQLHRRPGEGAEGQAGPVGPMMPQVVNALARLKDSREHFTGDGDLVFCSPVGAHLDAWALRRRYYRAVKKAKLRRLRFHDLRHAFGTAAIGVLDAYRVQSYMGHQHYSTTQRYLHHQPRPEDARALERAFGGQDAGQTLPPPRQEPANSGDSGRTERI